MCHNRCCNINPELSCWPPWVEYNLTVTFMTLFVVLSLQSPCSAVVCGNNGKCVALYKENSYICLCKEGFTGRNCETGKIVPYMVVILGLYDESEHC